MHSGSRCPRNQIQKEVRGMGITVRKVVQINGLRLLDEGVVASMTLEVAHSKSALIFTSWKAETGIKA
jgi:hypothetical protein